LNACLDRLPENWRGPAESAGSEDLQRWSKECDDLAEYESLSSDVEHAKRSKAALVERIANLGVLLDEVPDEARRPAREVEEELAVMRDRATEKDTVRREAERHLEDVLRRRQEREELETHRREAERQRGAHNVLHNLLGPSGVQSLLLRAAEQGLVSLANETLDGLSRGRMRLKLRERDDQQKALDLEVLDGDTGSNPVPVNLTSGSQRFRIAVSLALAIGRYKGQQARRIRSVIIDEGFGSLDKNSRDDMIRVLDDLQQALDKVILVSHQEEFATAFSNGYTVSRNHDSSEVALLQPS
jgi:DNA repair protein SbcC/Rad50